VAANQRARCHLEESILTRRGSFFLNSSLDWWSLSVGVLLDRSISQFYRKCAGRVYSHTEGGFFWNSYFGLWWLLVCQSLSVGLFLDWSNLQFYMGVLEESILALRGAFLKIHFFGLQWLCQSPILADLFLDCSTLHVRVHFLHTEGGFFQIQFWMGDDSKFNF